MAVDDDYMRDIEMEESDEGDKTTSKMMMVMMMTTMKTMMKTRDWPREAYEMSIDSKSSHLSTDCLAFDSGFFDSFIPASAL